MVFLRHLHLGYKQSALYATVDSRTESEDESVEIEESADQEEKKSSDLVE